MYTNTGKYKRTAKLLPRAISTIQPCLGQLSPGQFSHMTMAKSSRQNLACSQSLESGKVHLGKEVTLSLPRW